MTTGDLSYALLFSPEKTYQTFPGDLNLQPHDQQFTTLLPSVRWREYCSTQATRLPKGLEYALPQPPTHILNVRDANVNCSRRLVVADRVSDGGVALSAVAGGPGAQRWAVARQGRPVRGLADPGAIYSTTLQYTSIQYIQLTTSHGKL